MKSIHNILNLRNTIICILLILAISCTDESQNIKNSNHEEENPTYGKARDNGRVQAVGQYIDHDWSGEIEIIYYYLDYGPSQQPGGSAQLPAGYVLIGGGAYTFNVDAGALLVSSYPDKNTNSWVAYSKSHIDSDPHSLRVYAIGMKIQGLSYTTLKGLISYKDSESTSEFSHPSWNVNLVDPYVLIGGGAQVVNDVVTWGNMLTESYPSGQGWYVSSKDHINGDPAKIKAYAIGIPLSVPGYGNIDIRVTEASASVNSGFNTVNAQLVNDGYHWANTCIGAKDIYPSFGWGRMLTTLNPIGAPDSQTFPWAKSKDHKKACSGTLYTYGIYVRKRP